MNKYYTLPVTLTGDDPEKKREEIHPIYDDFSVPTFDGKHNLIKGGSWISTGNEIMKYSRYAFRRHFYQHAGFRYVEAEEVKQQLDNIYETDALVSQYCEFQYGETAFGVENFAQKCANLASEYTKQEHWLGGYRDCYGEEVCTVDTLKEILGNEFELMDRIDVPFVIRETPRKFQYTVSEMTVWKLT